MLLGVLQLNVFQMFDLINACLLELLFGMFVNDVLLGIDYFCQFDVFQMF